MVVWPLKLAAASTHLHMVRLQQSAGFRGAAAVCCGLQMNSPVQYIYTTFFTCEHAPWQWRARCHFESQLLRLALQHGLHPVQLTGVMALWTCRQHVDISNYNLQTTVHG